MSEYKIIDIPLEGDMYQLDKRILKSFFKWYLDEMPRRQRMLEETIKQTQSFETWRHDYTADSMNLLEKWIRANVEITKELSDIGIKDKHIIPVNFNIVEKIGFITPKWQSIAIDTGYYYGEMLIHEFEFLHWDMILNKSRRYIYFGQPCITGFAKLDAVNPAHNMYGFINLVSKGKQDDSLAQYRYIKSNISLEKP